MNILFLFSNNFSASRRLYNEITISHRDILAMKLDTAILSNTPTVFVQVAVDLNLVVGVYERILLLVFVNHALLLVKSNRFVCLYYTIIGTISQVSLAYLAKFSKVVVSRLVVRGYGDAGGPRPS